MALQTNTLPRISEASVQSDLSVPIRSVSTSFYRPELDALRFFAFLGVFQLHAAYTYSIYVRNGAPRWVQTVHHVSYAGAFGVDLFFVLSAYLITELLLREKARNGSLDVRAFYVRRILRIWPIYFFCIFLALIPAFNALHTFSWRYALAFLFLAGNWSFMAWGAPLRSIANALWTVSIEEQFYLLWPPIVRRISPNRLTWVAVTMIVLSTAMRSVLLILHAQPNSVKWNTLARLDPIAAGIFIASVLHGRLPTLSVASRLAMLASSLLSLVLVSNNWRLAIPPSLEVIPTIVGYPCVTVACTVILLAVLGFPARIPRVLAYLGKISYGLYVYHLMALVLTTRLLGDVAYVLRVLQRGTGLVNWLRLDHAGLGQLMFREALWLATTIFLAGISYAFLEKPFLQLKKRFELVRSRPV